MEPLPMFEPITQPKPTHETISLPALIKRINRYLAHKNERLCVTRGTRWFSDLGQFAWPAAGAICAGVAVVISGDVLATTIRSDLARLRTEGARRIRITVTAAELELLRPLCTVTSPPRGAEHDGRDATFDGHGVFVGSARGYSWKR